MRTNIVIDQKPMKDALRSSGAKTKRDVVELGLRRLVQLAQQEKARRLRGLGITVRKTIDTIIATRCIEDGLELLHANHDFDAFEAYPGLRVVGTEAGR